MPRPREHFGNLAQKDLGNRPTRGNRHLVVISSSNATIGGGHISRQISLAKHAILQGFSISFVGQVLQGAISEIESLPANLITLSSATDWLEHERAIQQLNSVCPISAVVVDNYQIASSITQEAMGLEQVIVACFEDGPSLTAHADLIVNSGVDKASSPFILESMADRCQDYLVGVDAAIIRPELLEVRKTRESEIETLDAASFGYVNFGLSQVSHLYQVFVKLAREARVNLPFEFRLVFGAEISEDSPVQAEELPKGLSLPKEQVAFLDVLSQASAAIGAGGVSAFERAFLGIPSINCPISDNQVGISRILASAGAAIDLELGWAENGFALNQAVNELSSAEARLNMSRAGRGLVDGFGAERVVGKIVKLLDAN